LVDCTCTAPQVAKKTSVGEIRTNTEVLATANRRPGSASMVVAVVVVDAGPVLAMKAMV
jgi:hypothetical protein